MSILIESLSSSSSSKALLELEALKKKKKAKHKKHKTTAKARKSKGINIANTKNEVLNSVPHFINNSTTPQEIMSSVPLFKSTNSTNAELISSVPFFTNISSVPNNEIVSIIPHFDNSSQGEELINNIPHFSIDNNIKKETFINVILSRFKILEYDFCQIAYDQKIIPTQCSITPEEAATLIYSLITNLNVEDLSTLISLLNNNFENVLPFLQSYGKLEPTGNNKLSYIIKTS